MKIENNKLVTIHYHMFSAENELLDTADASDPFIYTHGVDSIIPGMLTGFADREQGDKLTLELTADQAFGDYHPELIQQVPREAFEGIEEIEVGMLFQAEQENGDIRTVTVKDIEGDIITLDGNHTLAGQDIRIEAEIISVEEPKAQH